MAPFIHSTVIALLTSAVAGHGGIWNYSIAGDWRPGFFPYHPAANQRSIQRHWTDFRPITDVTSPTLMCNHPGTPAEEHATVRAGAEIQAYYPGWPHDIGAVVVWMAYCGAAPDACSESSFNGTGTGTGPGAGRRHWFKIDEAGLVEGGIMCARGVWAQKRLVANNFTWLGG